MNKPYDLADLAKKAKDAGLDLAEDGAVKLYGILKAWISESATLSPTPLDDLAIPFLKQVDAVVLPQLDKIDGKVG